MPERLVHVACGAKTEKARTVPFTEETKTWLDLWRPIAGGEYITGEQIGTNALGERYGLISRAVGFRVHAHQVRHTTARIWVASTKAHPFDIAAMLGHETMDMTKHYYHTEGGHLRMIQDSLNKPMVTESVTHNN